MNEPTTSTERPWLPVGQDWATKAEAQAGHRHVLGEKCDVCAPEAPWAYAGGATSFGEYDEYEAAADVQRAVEQEMNVFDMLLANIRGSADLDARAKAARIRDLATELDTRLAIEAAEADGMASYGAKGVPATTRDPGSVMVFKDERGDYRWLAIHSNKFQDREGDIFSEKAHQTFVEEANASGVLPTLRLWHVPYDVGVSDYLDYDTEGFVVSSGTFYKGMEDIADRLMAMDGLGCSHGYLYRKADYREGVYHSYRSFEISVLPRERAANTLTAFFAGEEFPMSLSPARKAFLEEVAGPDRVAAMEEGVAALAETAREHGITYKALEERLVGRREEGGSATEAAAATPAAAPAGAATALLDPPAAVAPAVATPATVVQPAPVAAPVGEEPTGQAATAPMPSAEDEAAAAAALAAAGLAAPVAEAEAEPEDALTKALGSAFERAMAPIALTLGAMDARLTEQADEIAGLRAAQAAGVADIVRPRIGPDARVLGNAASRSDANLLPADGAEAKALAAAKAGESEMKSGAKAADPYFSDMVGIFGGNGAHPVGAASG